MKTVLPVATTAAIHSSIALIDGFDRKRRMWSEENPCGE
jgi:hypothetical protein